MAPSNYDVAAAVFNFLKTDDDASDVRDLLVSGATSVLEAGDVTAKRLTDFEGTRRTGGNSDLALCVAIQFDGSEKLSRNFTQQRVVVRIYDRQKGFSNIREVRTMIRKVLKYFHCVLVDIGDTMQGLVTCSFEGSSGDMYDLDFAVFYDALTFVAIVETAETY